MSRVGINRKVEQIGVADKVFDIAIVPIHVNYLMVQHDAMDAEYEKDRDIENLAESAERQAEMVYEIVSDLLEANGYVFDQEWWEKSIDYQGMVEFIVFAMGKDYTDTKKKVVGAGASGK